MEGMTATPEHPLGWHLFRLPGHSNRAAIGMRHLPLRAQRALKGMGLIGKKGKTAGVPLLVRSAAAQAANMQVSNMRMVNSRQRCYPPGAHCAPLRSQRPRCAESLPA